MSNNAKVVWNFLYEHFKNPYGVAGLMGNLYAESALNPINLQNTYEKKFGMTNEEYTAAVDKGAYANFVHDSAGYGLAQWTYWSRKQNLLNYVQQKKASIGDLTTQLEFLVKELQSYKDVYAVLKAAKSVREASDVVVTKYERPANQSETVKVKRCSYGQKYFDQYATVKNEAPKEENNTMTANEKRKAVIAKYKEILGRNVYSQSKRDYCFKKYKDGKYYSDCSSSISYCYKEAGFGFGILNTVGMYQSKKMTSVPVIIKNGQIQNPEVLRIGDMLLFAGSDSGRAYAGYVGHVEMVYEISGTTVTLCGHGSGRPSTKKMTTYCKSRYNSRSKTKLGHKGLIKVVRFIQDDGGDSTVVAPVEPQKPTTAPASKDIVKIMGGSVYVRTGPGMSYSMYKVAHKGDEFERLNADGWIAILFEGKVRWISGKYVSPTGLCSGNTVNVRTGAGTEFPSVGVVHKNDRLSKVDYKGWIPVVIDRDVKWVSEKYAKVEA